MASRSLVDERLAPLNDSDWTTRVDGLRALGDLLETNEASAPQAERVAMALRSLASDSKWEVRRELALLLGRPVVDEALAGALLDSLREDHTRWVRETATRSTRARTAEVRARRKKELTPIPPEPHLKYTAERVAELGTRSLTPHVVYDLVAQGGEYFYRELAADTAHEVRTLLTPIVGYFEKMKRHLEASGAMDEKASTYARTISARLDQLRVLIDQITVYASQEQLAYERSDLGAIVRDAVQIARDKSASDATIVDQFPERLEAEVSASRLRQAIVNVVSNALEAMPRGGTLTIGGANGAQRVRLTFIDTGAGLTAEQLDSVFLRFRTTKRAQGGSGLGLPIAKRIVENEHGGSIEMTSTVGVGTKVEIVLPVVRAKTNE
ncbi:MAG: ATP-binding protein [Deltaproteobacteria bacterium]